VKQLLIFAPASSLPATAYIERHRSDGALLPPAAEFPDPAYWLDPQDLEWVPIEEQDKSSAEE
jgi:hypothetical protein